MRRALSRVRHKDKLECVKLCIQKEKEGWECVQPIQSKGYRAKHFNRSGRNFNFAEADEVMYWEAVYVKDMR